MFILIDYLNFLVQLKTGSGKTFTITGGAERYIDRGIIPRTLSYMFDYFSKVSYKFVFTYSNVHNSVTSFRIVIHIHKYHNDIFYFFLKKGKI